MKHIVIIFLFISSVLNAQHLLPQPKELNLHEGKFKIANNIKVRVTRPSLKLNRYTERFIQRLEYSSGVYFQHHKIQDTISSYEIVINTNSTTENIHIETNESYAISITSNKVIITAENNIGAYRALETLLQLITTSENGPFFNNCSIVDEPRFKWRGLLIDVCRHWIPPHIIKRNIDAMAAVKMNVLHLHLTEDQGFRIESKKFPKLHELGNNGNYFTQEDIKEIIQYANERGIRVVPEFDIPGHITSWLVGYPKLASANRNYEIATKYGVFKASLNPTEEYTYQFLDTLLTEMCQLFPDAYFHIGGDENNGSDWNQNKKIQKFMTKMELKNNHELQAYFNKRILPILIRNKKIMIGWDEIYDSNMPNSIAIQSWRGKESMIHAAKNGFPSLLSNGYYLDKVYKIEDYYENDPLPKGIDLTESQQKMILGGEATMWSEIVDQTTIESRIWPSALAIAERLWSSSENCDTKNFYVKVPFISNKLQEFGLTHINYQETLLGLISNNSSVQTWKPFIKVLEPIRGYKRHDFLKKTLKYSSITPLNRIADACYVESFTARNFNKLIHKNCKKDGFCKYRNDIKYWLAKWAKSAENFQRISYKSTALSEAHELALKVQEICELAWRKVNSPSELTDRENQRAKKLISEIDTYQLDIRFAPIDGIKILFN
ncbi:MAG: beta-N-acetylhexosaminidase [Flavobacteriales bacterium]